MSKVNLGSHFITSGSTFFGFWVLWFPEAWLDRKSTRLNSSHVRISYAVFCLKLPSTPLIYSLSLHDALPIFFRILVQIIFGSGRAVFLTDVFVGSVYFTFIMNVKGELGFPLHYFGQYIFRFLGSLVSRSMVRSEEHTSELQSRPHLVCRLLLEATLHPLDLLPFPTRRSSDLFSDSRPNNLWKWPGRISD